jgi:hypothetical protein
VADTLVAAGELILIDGGQHNIAVSTAGYG